MAALTIVSSYLGYDKYEQYKESKAASSQSVEVNIASIPDSATLTKGAVERMIEKAIKAQHEKDVKKFKARESWE